MVEVDITLKSICCALLDYEKFPYHMFFSYGLLSWALSTLESSISIFESEFIWNTLFCYLQFYFYLESIIVDFCLLSDDRSTVFNLITSFRFFYMIFVRSSTSYWIIVNSYSSVEYSVQLFSESALLILFTFWEWFWFYTKLVSSYGSSSFDSSLSLQSWSKNESYIVSISEVALLSVDFFTNVGFNTEDSLSTVCFG